MLVEPFQRDARPFMRLEMMIDQSEATPIASFRFQKKRTENTALKLVQKIQSLPCFSLALCSSAAKERAKDLWHNRKIKTVVGVDLHILKQEAGIAYLGEENALSTSECESIRQVGRMFEQLKAYDETLTPIRDLITLSHKAQQYVWEV
ncbi:MAG: hypothetical protein K0S07_222 [Chlamydiales bacterium]|jgi:hypothetical protein|nr:hypothetical protein [Chlamydiales bacterium]